MFCTTGISQEAKQSIRDFCVRNSVPSPCKSDTIRARDERNNYVELEEINSDEKWMEVNKRYHTMSVMDMHKQWLWETPDLQTRERLSRPREKYKQRMVISRISFSKYCPNHIQKKDYLSQFGCESGIEFEWLHKEFIKVIVDNHHCGDINKCALLLSGLEIAP